MLPKGIARHGLRAQPLEIPIVGFGGGRKVRGDGRTRDNCLRRPKGKTLRNPNLWYEKCEEYDASGGLRVKPLGIPIVRMLLYAAISLGSGRMRLVGVQGQRPCI